MPHLTRAAFWAVALTAGLLPGGVPADEKPKKPPTVMQRKLTNAQLVLEGLALNDFDKIAKGADELTRCASEASWRAIKSPKYESYSNDFLRNLESLKKGAKKKNTDAAALAYVELTLTCVKCHQFLRDERMGAARPALPPKPLAAR